MKHGKNPRKKGGENRVAKNQNETSVTFKVFNKQFKDGMKENEEAGKKLRQELKLEQEQLKLAGSQTQKFSGELSNLQKQYELSQQKTEATRKALDEAKGLFGENSQAVADMEKKLRSAQISEQQIANKIEITSEKLEQAKQAESDRAKQLDSLKTEQDKLQSSSEKLTKEYELQKAELGENASSTRKAKLENQYLADQMKNSAEQVSNLENQLDLAKKQFGDNSTEVDKLEKELLDAKIAATDFSNQYKVATDSFKNFSEKAKKIGDGMQDVGKKWTMGVTTPILAGAGLSVKAASDFESALAGVKKTIDEQVDSNGKVTISYADLEKGIRNMAKEIPASASEISAVAESAGQLGIKTKDVLGFTRTMIDLGEATNMTSEDAASSLARLANITQMPQKNFDKLGSSIVALGNNMATTESDIVEMSLRLAGSAEQANMSENQILGIAAAMSSVGINAEAGGGSMSRVMQKIQTQVMSGGKDLSKFAEISGMSSQEFQKAWKEDAAQALVEFVTGLGKAKESGEDVTSVLKDMGISSTQEIDTMLRLSGAGDMLGESLKISADGWKENSALTEEASKRYETFQSKTEILKNKLTDLGIEVGGPLMDALMDMIDALDPVFKVLTNIAEAFSNASPETQKFIMTIGGILAVAGPILIVAGKLAGAIGSIAELFGTGGALAGVGKLITGTLLPKIGTFITAIVGWPLVIGAAIALIVFLIFKYWDQIKDFFSKLGDWFGKFFSDLGENISAKWGEITTSVVETLTRWKDTIVSKFTEIYTGVADTLSQIRDWAVEIFNTIKDWIVEKVTNIKDSVIEIFTSIVEFLSEIGQFIIDAIMVPISLLQTLLEAAWLLISTGVQIAWLLIEQYIVTPIMNGVDVVIGLFQSLGEWLSAKWSEITTFAGEKWAVFKDTVLAPIVMMKDQAIETVMNLWSGVTGWFTKTKDSAIEKVTSLWSGVSGWFNKTKDSASEKFNSIKESVSNKMSSAKESAVSKATEIWSGMSSKFSDTYSSAKEKFNKIKDAIITPITAAKDKIKEVLDKIVNFFKDLKFPRFSLETSTKKILGKEFTVPSGIGIKWNADGGIFRKPTIFGANNGILQGAGEAGPEAALPLNKKTLGQIGESIISALSSKDVMSPLLDGLIEAAQTKMVQTNEPKADQMMVKFMEMMSQFMEMMGTSSKGNQQFVTNIGNLNTNSVSEYDQFNRKMQQAAKLADSGLRN